MAEGFTNLFLGEEGITDLHIGDALVSSIYLGNQQVFSDGPFEGLIVSPKKLLFGMSVSQKTLKIKSSEPWTISTDADWLSFSQMSGDSGETTITVTSTAEEDSETTINVSSSSYSKTVQASFITIQYVTDIYYPNSATKVPITTPILSTTNLVTEFNGTNLIKTGDDIVASTMSDDNHDYRFFYFTNSVYFDLDYLRMQTANLGISVDDFDIMFGTKIHSTAGDKRLFIKNVKTGNLNEICTLGSAIAPSEYMYANVNYMHLKELKMWDSYEGNLIFDGKAAERDGQGGLWDSISNQFYTNNDYTISYTE